MPRRLGRENYLHFLENNLNDLFDEVSPLVRENMWFMQDDVPAHYSLTVRHQNFSRRWIDRSQNAPIVWPLRSPHLNPCDFYLWSHFKA